MILRRPYAFLIKHFKKIHISLLIFTVYIFYKNMQFHSFINDYIELGIYNSYIESVDRYTNILFYVIAILIVLVSAIMIYLLRFKKKPYLFYVFLIGEYLALIFIFMYGSHYFHTIYESASTMASLALRDMLFIATIPQYVIFILLFIRSLGLDLKKFGFQEEDSFVLSENDNEEFEVQLEVDKDDLKRNLRKQMRYLTYFYKEHSFVLTILFGVLLLGSIGYTYLYFGILHKSYGEGQSFQANNYRITINQSYMTDKNKSGEVIAEKDKVFVILDVSVDNLGSEREIDIEKFMLMNQNQYAVPTVKYNQAFQDLGTPYEKGTLKVGAKTNFLLIYQIDKKLLNKNFALFYQEIASTTSFKLRKIKLKVKDMTTLSLKTSKKTGEEMELLLPSGEKKNFTINSLSYQDQITYYYEKCYVHDCSIVTNTVSSSQFGQNKKILELSFQSFDLNGKELIDFLRQYGKINYENSEGKSISVDVRDAVLVHYTGNYLYLVVPDEVVSNTNNRVLLTWTIRDSVYQYQLS